MTKEAGLIIGQDSQVSEHPTKRRIEFCEEGVSTMCSFYGVNKLNFEQMLQNGYTEISFGRGPFGFSDEKTAKHIVAFAAFFKEDSPKIKTLEVRKECGTFGSYSEGLSERKYSSDKYQKTVDQFKLLLVTEDLAGFIQRFSWPQQ